MPYVSIIVRTKNEENWIGLCLDAIVRQNYTDFEIILVDNKSTDQTVEKAIKYGVKLVEIEEFKPGKAINDGIRVSTGEVIVIISGHCIPVNENWLGNLIGSLNNHQIAGVYGRQEPMSFTSALDKRDLAITFGLDPKIQMKDSFFHNANSALTREMWEKVPFDENATNIEDRIWGANVIDAGFYIAYEPTASVYHYHGIHQGRNIKRAESIIRIMENLHGESPSLANIVHKNQKVVAFIPVRGKSLTVDGVSLIENTITYLKECSLLTDIVGSTDCEETAEIAIGQGASVPFMRPKSLSEQYIDISQVISYTLKEYEKKFGLVDAAVIVEETHPFRDQDMIDDMVTELLNSTLDSVVASKHENRPIWLNDSQGIQNIGNHRFMPRDLNEECFYIGTLGLGCVTRPEIVRNGGLFGENIGLHKINHPLGDVEIRTVEDMKLCMSLLTIGRCKSSFI